MTTRKIWRLVPLTALAAVVVAVVSAGAFGGGAVTAPSGNAVNGKKLFASSGCGACHVLKSAGAKGTIGPNLDTLTPTYAQIVAQITKGGPSIMGKAAAAYKFPMASFKGKLTTKQIQDVAAFVFTTSLRKAAPKTTTTTAAATSSSSTGSSSTGSSTGAAAANPDGCPPGLTIVTNASDDHDDDDIGGPNDFDGCV